MSLPKSKPRSTPPRSSAAKELQQKLKSLDEGFKRAAASPKSALAFLKRAGIIDKSGNLAKPYR